jgi:cytoskeleton-associated protein 5
MQESTKWKDRKEALEALHTIANTPKLAPGNYSELIGALAKVTFDHLFV